MTILSQEQVTAICKNGHTASPDLAETAKHLYERVAELEVMKTRSVQFDLEHMKEIRQEGFWRSCSGCHETNEGYETGYYPYSEAFQCYQGSGCHECGGLGAIWDNIDYSNYEG